MLTYRESKYVVERSKGQSKQQALLACGFSPALAKNPQFIESPEVLAEIEKYRAELVENTIQTGLIDAIEIHEYLTEALRADSADIRDDEGFYLPVKEWPLIWRQMLEGGDLEIETEYARSDDGETKGKRGGWDESGTITKVKFKFASRAKLLELAMRHRGVNAMVEAKSETHNHLHLHGEITAKLQAALGRQERLIEAAKEPESTE